MEDLLNALKSLAEPTRLRILAICREGELTVSELVRVLGQSQPRVSRHLKLLTEGGVLDRVPEGSWVFYRLATGGDGAALARRILDLLPQDDRHLERDRQRLAEVREARAEAAASYFRRNAHAWSTLRALHVDEAEVEAEVRRMLGADEGIDLGHLLDIGTGTGEMLRLLADRVEEGEGIDLSRDMLVVARSELAEAGVSHCRVRQADMYDLPFDDKRFDTVVIHQVLHYTDDPDGAIAEAARVLKPNGRLLVVDFAPHQQENLREEHNHRRLGFAEDEITGAFETAGLSTGSVEKLAGEPLTVTLWLGVKDADAKVRPLPRPHRFQEARI